MKQSRQFDGAECDGHSSGLSCVCGRDGLPLAPGNSDGPRSPCPTHHTRATAPAGPKTDPSTVVAHSARTCESSMLRPLTHRACPAACRFSRQTRLPRRDVAMPAAATEATGYEGLCNTLKELSALQGVALSGSQIVRTSNVGAQCCDSVSMRMCAGPQARSHARQP